MTTTLTPYQSRIPLFDDFRKEMDSLMSRFFENGGTTAEISAWTPRLNLSETDKNYELSIELPGLKPDDVNVEIRHGELWITGQRRDETEEKGRTWHRIERYYGEFRRVVRLGDDVNPAKVEAEFKDGVLCVTVPKTEVAQPKRITIKG